MTLDKHCAAIPNPQSPIRNPNSPIRNPNSPIRNPNSPIRNPNSPIRNPNSPIRNPQSPIPNPQSPIRNPQSPIRNPNSPIRNPNSPIRNLLLLLLLLPLHLFAQDPDLDADEAARMEEVFRTSDHDDEIPTNYRKRHGKQRRVSVPPGAFRIGCICMDDTRSDTRSTGACSGHGGVRYWVYRTTGGDTVHILTARHERHPHPLSAAEMSELSQKRAERTQNLPTVAKPLQPVPYSAPAPVVVLPSTEAADQFTWVEAALFAVGGVSLYFTIRLLLQWVNNNEKLVRYALRNLLRHRKRPAARPNRKTPPKARLP
jgi:hypothetical protein